MEGDRKNITIDEFYAEKFKLATPVYDADSGWDNFEKEAKRKFRVRLVYFILVLMTLLSLSLYGYYNYQKKNKEQVSKISNSTSHQSNILKRNSEQTILDFSSSDSTISIENKFISSTQGRTNFDYSDVLSSDNRMANNGGAVTNSTFTVSSKIPKNELTYSNKLLSDFGGMNHNLKEPSNVLPRVSLSDHGKNSNVLSNETLYFALLSKYIIPVSSDRVLVYMPTLINPLSKKSDFSRLTLSVGLSMHQSFSISDNFELVRNNYRFNLAQVKFSYRHLSLNNFETVVHFSYNKIKSEVEFVGNRIVRLYSDDNISVGYGVGWQFTKKLNFMNTLSLGYSKISKIEFEQKPIWQDGEVTYDDFSKTKFDFKITPTYQFSSHLNFAISRRLDLYGGIVWRTQFTNQLMSSEILRENTLDGFSNLNYFIGTSYSF